MSSLARPRDRETDELDAIRFHLSTEVNALQFHRKAETEGCAFKNTPILLQRLIQDVDHWLSTPKALESTSWSYALLAIQALSPHPDLRGEV